MRQKSEIKLFQKVNWILLNWKALITLNLPCKKDMWFKITSIQIYKIIWSIYLMKIWKKNDE